MFVTFFSSPFNKKKLFNTMSQIRFSVEHLEKVGVYGMWMFSRNNE